MPKTLPGGLVVYTTNDWGARAPLHTFAVTTPSVMVVHHMANANRPPIHDHNAALAYAFNLARETQAFHMDAPDHEWSDTGQHWTVTIDGIVCEGRHGSLDALFSGHCIVGAHAPGANSSWGTEHEGTYTDHAMPTTQWDATVKLHAALSYLCKLDTASIHGHREFISTQCPGDALFGRLPQLRTAAHAAKLALLQAHH